MVSKEACCNRGIWPKWSEKFWMSQNDPLMLSYPILEFLGDKIDEVVKTQNRDDCIKYLKIRNEYYLAII